MKSHALNPVIADEIAREGPIPFARFMEIALYEPRYGYYASGRAGVGKAGDFFTSVSLGPVFGEMLAGQFLEMWEALGRPEDFTIIEQGANDAQLACDVLDALAGTALGAARFVIIEPFPVLRAIQSEKLRGRRVSWVGSPEALPAFCGVHFSNELFDAFPVHVVRSNGIGWDELHVASGPGGFSWEPLPPAGEVAKALAFYPPRPAGYTTELRLSHRAPLDSLAARLTSGFLLAIDYGMPFESLLAPHRGAGTLSCHANHRRDDNPLERPGEKTSRRMSILRLWHGTPSDPDLFWRDSPTSTISLSALRPPGFAGWTEPFPRLPCEKNFCNSACCSTPNPWAPNSMRSSFPKSPPRRPGCPAFNSRGIRRKFCGKINQNVRKGRADRLEWRTDVDSRSGPAILESCLRFLHRVWICPAPIAATP